MSNIINIEQVKKEKMQQVKDEVLEFILTTCAIVNINHYDSPRTNGLPVLKKNLSKKLFKIRQDIIEIGNDFFKKEKPNDGGRFFRNKIKEYFTKTYSGVISAFDRYTYFDNRHRTFIIEMLSNLFDYTDTFSKACVITNAKGLLKAMDLEFDNEELKEIEKLHT